MAEIGIIGAGSWGTALAVLCVNNGHDVTVWSRTKRDHKKDSRLPGVEIRMQSALLQIFLKR